MEKEKDSNRMIDLFILFIVTIQFDFGWTTLKIISFILVMDSVIYLITHFILFYLKNQTYRFKILQTFKRLLTVSLFH